MCICTDIYFLKQRNEEHRYQDHARFWPGEAAREDEEDPTASVLVAGKVDVYLFYYSIYNLCVCYIHSSIYQI